MKVSGQMEVFINKNGYLTGKLPYFKNQVKLGDFLINVSGASLLEDLKSRDANATLRINVLNGYLDLTNTNADDDKLVIRPYISVKEYEVVREFIPTKQED